jgi:beta propeller repeat protein
MKNKTILIALALMCLIGSVSIASAQITKIGTGVDPAVYGSKVTWSDTAGSIHIYDLTTKKNTKISSSQASYPAIYGNKLVWHDESSGVPRITVYDIPSGIRTFVTQNIDERSIPHIYGNYIVWSANGGVYLRYMSPYKDVKSTQTQIAVGDSPDIYGTKITYTYDNGDMPSVYVYDIATKKTINASGSGENSSPHIYGNKVIWSNYFNAGYIAMYDTSTKKSIGVTDENGCAGSHTSIYGDKIAYARMWSDSLGTAGVYVYSIPSAQSTQIFNYSDDAYTTPAIYGNTVAWGIDGSNTFSDNAINDNGIYVCDLAAKPIASFTANQVYGTHSLPVTFTYIGTGGGTPNSYLWDFGDKTTSKHALTATHTYTKAGTYTVSLKVTNSAGSNTATKTKYITVK